MSAVLVSDQYFKKKKAFAFGIVMSGSGVGSIIIPFVMRPLFDNYDFTGAMLLHGESIQEFMCIGVVYYGEAIQKLMCMGVVYYGEAIQEFMCMGVVYYGEAIQKFICMGVVCYGEAI